MYKIGRIKSVFCLMAFAIYPAIALCQPVPVKQDFNISVPLHPQFNSLRLENKGCARVFFRELIVSLRENFSAIQYFCNNDEKEPISTYLDMNSGEKIAPLYDDKIFDGREVTRVLAQKRMARSLPYEVTRHWDENPVVYVGGLALSITASSLPVQCGCQCKNQYPVLELRTIDGDVIWRKLLFGLRSKVIEVEGSGYCRTDDWHPVSDAPTYQSSLNWARPMFWTTVDGRILIAGLTNSDELPLLFAVPATLENHKAVLADTAAFIDADAYESFMVGSIESYLKSDKGKDAGKRAWENAERELKEAVLSGRFDNSFINASAKSRLINCPSEGNQQQSLELNKQGEAMYSKSIDQALALFEQSADTDPSFARGYSNLSLAYYKTKKFDAAERSANLAIACGWRDSKLLAGALFNLGKVFEARGNNKKARYLYERAYWNNPLDIYLDSSTRVHN